MNFIKHLRWEDMPARQRVLAAFVLTCVMDGNPKGQEKCLQKLLHTTCFELLEDGVVGDVSAAILPFCAVHLLCSCIFGLSLLHVCVRPVCFFF